GRNAGVIYQVGQLKEIRVVSLRINSSAAELATLPIPNGDHPADDRGQNKEQGSLYCAGAVRILVLDDDQAVCRVIQAALARKDFTVEAVSDPTHMEDCLRSQEYHVIIL